MLEFKFEIEMEWGTWDRDGNFVSNLEKYNSSRELRSSRLTGRDDSLQMGIYLQHMVILPFFLGATVLNFCKLE